MEGGAILSVIVYFNQKSLLVVYRYRCHCFGGFQLLLLLSLSLIVLVHRAHAYLGNTI